MLDRAPGSPDRSRAWSDRASHATTRGVAFLLRAGITHSFPTSHRHCCRECEVVEEAASDREGSPNPELLPTGPCRARRGVDIVDRSASSLHLP